MMAPHQPGHLFQADLPLCLPKRLISQRSEVLSQTALGLQCFSTTHSGCGPVTAYTTGKANSSLPWVLEPMGHHVWR